MTYTGFRFPGRNAVPSRPADKAQVVGGDVWARDRTSANADDGTDLDATFVNRLKANLELFVTALGGSLAEGDEQLKKAIIGAMALKAALASPEFSGTPTGPTAALGNNTSQLATTAFVQAALDALVAAAPGQLNTLDELAAALGDDEDFAATVTAALAGKQPLNAQLTAIAALTTTVIGRSLLAAADAPALRTILGLAAVAATPTIANITGLQSALDDRVTYAYLAGAGATPQRSAAYLLGGEEGAAFDFLGRSALINDYSDVLTDAGRPEHLLTVSRASVAAYVARDRLVKFAPANALRYDHDFLTGVPLGICVEGARTNRVLHNRDLSNAAWAKLNATGSKTATGVDGVTNSASILTASASNGRAAQHIANASAARATSLYVKRRTGTGNVYLAQGVVGAALHTEPFTYADKAAAQSAGWSANGTEGGSDITWTISSNQLSLTRGSGSTTGNPRRTFTGLTAGVLYMIQWTTVSGDVAAALTAGSDVASYGGGFAAGVHRRYFVATATSATLEFWCTSTSTTVVIDDLSIAPATETDITSQVTAGWRRVELASATIANPAINLRLATNGDAIDVDLAQIEDGVFSSSPIETAGSAATRAADDVSIALTALPFGTLEGSLTVAFALTHGSAASALARVAACLTENAGQEAMSLSVNTSGVPAAGTLDGNVSQAAFTFGAAFAAAALVKLAFGWRVNDFAGVRDAGTPSTDTAGTIATPTHLRLGSAAGGTDHLFGWVHDVTYISRRLSDSELQARTRGT